MHRPRVLFLDEPTAGIDPVARRELWNLLFTLAGEGVTLLVTTHYMDEAERCGRVAYLYLSKMLVEGDPDELTRLPEITPAGTRRVEADCERGAAAVMTQARMLPYVEDVTIFGNALHLLVRADVADAQIARDLEETSRAKVTIRPIEASLEDVFVRLTRLQIEQRGEIPSRGGEGAMRGFLPVLKKEAVQMIRDRGTLRFALLVPAFQLVLFGLIDTNVKHVRTAVFDQSRTQESRQLVNDFVNTSYFDIVANVPSKAALKECIVAGRASVGIEIPPDYAPQAPERRTGGRARPDRRLGLHDLERGAGRRQRGRLRQVGHRAGRARPREGSAHPDTSAPALQPRLAQRESPDPGTRRDPADLLRHAPRRVRDRPRAGARDARAAHGDARLSRRGRARQAPSLPRPRLCAAPLRARSHDGDVPRADPRQPPAPPRPFGRLPLRASRRSDCSSPRAPATQMEAIQLAQMFLLPSIMLSGYIFPLSSLPGPLRVRLADPPRDALHRDLARDHHPRRRCSATSGARWPRCW